MANFDPQVQPGVGDNPFIYGYGARPIQEPKPNVSGEIEGKTIGKGLDQAGNIIKGAANLAFNVEKENIDTGLHQQYDPVQSEWINRWSKVDDVLHRSGGENLLDETVKQNYPTEIQKLPGMVDQLMGLRDNGKVSTTYLDMQRDAIAKQMRAKYPGMRDVIDQEFTRMTREDPANKVIQNISADIDAYVSAARAKKDAIGTKVLNGEAAGILPKGSYQAYQNNPQAGSAFLGALHDQNQIKLNLERDDLEMRNKEAHRKITKEDNTQSVYSGLDGLAAGAAVNFSVTLPGMQPMNIGTVMSQIDSGKLKLEPQQLFALGQIVDGHMSSFISQANLWGTQPFDPNNPKSQSRSSIMGPEEFNKAVLAKAEFFKTIKEHLLNQNTGMAYSVNNWVKETQLSAQKDAYAKIPGLAAFTALSKEAPNSPYMARFAEGFITDPNVEKGVQALVQGQTATLMTMPKSDTKYPSTLAEVMDSNSQSGLGGPAYATANDSIVSGLQWALHDPDSPWVIKHNAAHAIYSNPTTITRFNNSEVTDQGTVSPGKSTFLAKAVNTQTTNDIKKLADPQQTLHYIEFAKKSVGNIIWNDVAQLNKVSADPDIKIGWDADKSAFKLLKGPGFASTTDNTKFLTAKNVQKAITRINLALRSMVEVNQKLTHENMNDFMAEFFIESGMDPELIRGTIGGQFIEALIASQKPQPGHLPTE